MDYADDADRIFVESIVPEGAIAEALIAVVSYIDPSGASCWASHCWSDLPISSNVGLLEFAKLRIIANGDVGIPGLGE